MQYPVSFPGGTVQYLLQSSFDSYTKLAPADACVFITDANVARSYPELFKGKKLVVLEPGEEHKNLQTIELVVKNLLEMEAQRSSFLVGVGGGVVTDITGFVASVFNRGVSFGFIPTSLLAMVDAAIGGKNGVDVGLYKNVAGNFRQPGFILYDTSLLETLPGEEWSNGFAEILKYACLFDKVMFDELKANNINYYKENDEALQSLIARCVNWKNKIVLADETEQHERKLLNFGHTLGHAIENLHSLPHGQAVAIGMVAACKISEAVCGLSNAVTQQLVNLLQQYGLPARHDFNVEQTMEILSRDKKRSAGSIDYIVLEDIGKAAIMRLPLEQIKQAIASL